MPEQEWEVQTIKVQYVCDSCGNGHMVPTGLCLNSFPPKYPHTCNNCDQKQMFSERYPCMRYPCMRVREL